MRSGLEATAAFRRTRLKPLSQAIETLARRREGQYQALRRSQGQDAAEFPASFSEIVNGVRVFIDPLVLGLSPGSRWRARERRWIAAEPSVANS